MMPNADHDRVRPPAGDGSATGFERYTLIKAAFAHVQQSIRKGHYIEAITVLESILTDRLGSMVHGALRREVTLRHTLGGLVKLAKQGPLTTQFEQAECIPPLPDDVMDFLTGELSRWWRMRNHAVHAMAKLHHVDDASFAERYSKLSAVALDGVRVLRQLDEYDQREKEKNRAGRSATYPDALRLDSEIEKLIATSAEPTSYVALKLKTRPKGYYR
jgi:hypothetical protein